MATVESVMASKAGPAIGSSQAGQVTVQRGTYDLLATDSEDATFIMRLVKLPAQHVIIDLVMDNDDLDGVTAGAVDVGLEDSIQDPADTTDLTLFATAVDVQTAAIRVSHMSFAAARLPAVNYDRFVVVGIETVSTTGLVGRLGVTLTSKPALGDQFDGNFA